MSDQPDQRSGGETAEQREERLQARSAFMRDLAHEVSTPLTPLAGYLRILQSEKLGPLSAQQRRVVDTMLLSVSRLTRIVENLGDFASLGSERAPLSPGPIDVDALVEAVVEDLRPFIKDARLNVTVARAGGAPVQADARKLRQAVMNVVGNAVKFSPHGGEVLVELAREPGRLRLSVYDQGPGIKEGDQAGIFEPFHRARARAREAHSHHPGSGLGLPVARRILEAHGGRILLESPPHTQPRAGGRIFTGSRFILELPDGAAPAP